MSVAVNTIIDEIEEILSDTANDRWSAAELLTYLNSAQRDIAIRSVVLGVRPAYSKTQAVSLVAGPIQTIPTDGISLLDIHRNMGREWVTATEYDVNDAVYESSTRYVCLIAHTAGTFATDLTAVKWETSPLKSARNIEQMNEYELDAFLTNWRGDEPDSKSLVYNWVPITTEQGKFYVRPPQPNSTALQYVEMSYAAIPAEVSAGNNITIGDIYKEVIMDYILYKAYTKEDDQAEGVSRAISYFEAYRNNSVFGLR